MSRGQVDSRVWNLRKFWVGDMGLGASIEMSVKAMWIGVQFEEERWSLGSDQGQAQSTSWEKTCGGLHLYGLWGLAQKQPHRHLWGEQRPFNLRHAWISLFPGIQLTMREKRTHNFPSCQPQCRRCGKEEGSDSQAVCPLLPQMIQSRASIGSSKCPKVDGAPGVTSDEFYPWILV